MSSTHADADTSPAAAETVPAGDEPVVESKEPSPQYTELGILRYEKIFGEGFVSTGGSSTTASFLKRLQLKAGQRVLDVGCGIGGGDFMMAETYGVEVLGVDLSENMVAIAKRRAEARPGSAELVEFKVCDATTAEFAPGSFDVVYSRDTILHIKDKAALFKRFMTWLKPGGQLFISDYARGFPTVTDDVAELSGQFEAYVAQRGYDLRTPAAYGKVVEAAGFASVDAQDATDTFVDCLRKELATTTRGRAEFEEQFSAEDYEYIVGGWAKKLEFCAAGFQKWAVIHAVKPASA